MIKAVNKILSSIISFSLVFSPVFATETTNTYDRTAEKIEQFLKSGSPSDIPFLDYTDNFSSVSSQPLKQFNLSSFVGKKLFVGYGVYDTEQNFCRYIEKPGAIFPASDIKNITTFNKHSYAVSTTTLDYNSCTALASKYNGTPVIINSAAENGFISSKFRTNTGMGIDKWMGLSRLNCTTDYKNFKGGEQDYYNWSSSTEQIGTCDLTKLYVKQNTYGTWNKIDKSSLNHCVIEVDTEDITRPIKICAPWWKIEREYETEKETTFSGIDIYRINQADIPDQFDVCTKYREAATTTYEESPNREVTCTSYYDSTLDPICISDPYQGICKVDECSGYIKNACTLKDSFETFKNYTKTETNVNNVNIIQKGKTDIMTHVYSCPPSLPSIKNCEEQSTVMIYPKECPNSDCEAYKTCYANATTTDQKNACATAHPCEKIYGNPDNPEFNADGTLKILKGICSDGSVLEFQPNIQSKQSKKCLEYEKYTITEDVSQKCILDRKYVEHTIDTSLTEEDIYVNNPNCVRMNNLLDSRPLVSVLFNYKNKGFAKTVIRKSYLDGNMNSISTGTDTTITDAAMNAVDPYAVIASNVTNSQTTQKYDCSLYTEPWYTRQDQILDYNTTININGVSKNYLAHSMGMENTGELFVKYTNVSSSQDCSALSSSIVGNSNIYISATKECKVYINKYPIDIFNLIKGNGAITDSGEGPEYPEYTYTTKDKISKDDCNKVAYCLNGIYNQTAFLNATSSQCSVIIGDAYEYKDEDTALNIIDTPSPGLDENCKPLMVNDVYSSDLDGTKDIFSIQEVVDGTFGYFSNYNSHPFQNNFISINGKEVYPLKEMPQIDDPLIYDAEFTQWSITSSKPNLLLGMLAGAGAGLGALLVTNGLMATGVGTIVFVVILLFFGKKQKFNRQNFTWEIYKLVPVSRYVVNIYGYDKRILVTDKSTGLPIVDSQNRYKLLYASLNGSTGTLKPNDFKNLLKQLLAKKITLLTCLGWTKEELNVLDTPIESSVIVGYPKCKKLSFSCNKERSQTVKVHKNPFFKKMVNNYLGAVNGVSIIVPYLGDYEVQAYDAADNLLGQITIKEAEFLEENSNVHKYAQINFGLSMNLATGINEGIENNACREDLMVEWGGGISGIYYENNTTGLNQNCQKSHDGYVQSKSATKLKIKALNMDRPHVIELARPLPFANRVFLVTLNKKEIREYRCYEKFGSCKNTDFK